MSDTKSFQERQRAFVVKHGPPVTAKERFLLAQLEKAWTYMDSLDIKPDKNGTAEGE